MVSELLIQAYLAEREQARWYRALSVAAEEAGNLQDIEDLNGLVADEQHHVSRLKNRIVELGYEFHTDYTEATAYTGYERWKEVARQRERSEIERYEQLLGEELDEGTRDVIESILETEKLHEQNLGGKYTEA